MAAIDQIVNVTVSAATTAVASQTFSIPLIIGPTSPGWAATDYVHTYTAPSGMLTDGFTTASPEYVYAQAMYAQAATPTSFKVGKRSALAAQVNTLTVGTLTSGHKYYLTFQGTQYSYTAGGSDTQQSVLGALLTAITGATTAVTGAVTGTGSAATLTLTAATGGQTLAYTGIDPLLTLAQTTAANGIAQDLANVLGQDQGWYGFCLASGTDNDVLQAATWIEGSRKLYIAVSATAAIGTSSTTDVASQLKAGGFKRTGVIFSPGAAAQGIDAAWLGSQLAQVPGSTNWAFKTLAGITADTLTATQQSNAIGSPVAGVAGKNANIYQAVGGVNVTEMGTTGSGQYFDITVGVDWLQSTLQTNLYSLLANTAKVPYTNSGVAMLMSAVRQAIDQGGVNGLVDNTVAPTVTAPTVLSVSQNQRSQRIAPTISFSCRLAGANNAVVVNGTVTS